MQKEGVGEIQEEEAGEIQEEGQVKFRRKGWVKFRKRGQVKFKRKGRVQGWVRECGERVKEGVGQGWEQLGWDTRGSQRKLNIAIENARTS